MAIAILVFMFYPALTKTMLLTLVFAVIHYSNSSTLLIVLKMTLKSELYKNYFKE
ncbi:hypothetical protein SAMN04488027_1293 [Psychroflexus sediminis]|uniref:Uncharacterized protein n=1 Tax=Psychroflexus sediminis TaxID=470826 RepID=A0A1G7ZII6_9FLAO|nr:hypothetical protein SAMN04488027_1293 [Psychroflexus sediminis]